MQFILRIFCFLGIHFKSKWNEEGIDCETCGFHKSKAEHMADLHAGGGW